MNGLPAPLPPGETLLWQEKPQTSAFLKQLFGVKFILAYVGVLLGWCLLDGARGGNLAAAAAASLRFGALAVCALLLLAALARILAGSTLYSITTRRVIIAYGAAFEKTLQIPFTCIDQADLRSHGDGTGDIVLTLGRSQRVNYFFLWPHVLPWRVGVARPMLRALADATGAAIVLGRAMAAQAGTAPRPLDDMMPRPERAPVAQTA
ncbi:MAG TPA: photosynthetic complex putative assembly protein PuhB [Acetobacteraceae bacterium]|nr:photosynthetic complex putative assembly protein PuhB [Acetobacteraceae bacterium]